MKGKVSENHTKETRKALLSLIKIGSTITSALPLEEVYKTSPKKAYPAYEYYQSLSEAEKKESLNTLLEGMRAYLPSTEGDQVCPVTYEYMTGNMPIIPQFVGSLLQTSQFDEVLKKYVSEDHVDEAVALFSKGFGSDDYSYVASFLFKKGYYDLALGIEIFESFKRVPVNSDVTNHLIEQRKEFIRASRFTRNLISVLENTWQPYQLIDSYDGESLLTSGKRCNCSYNAFLQGLMEHLFSPNVTQEEIEHILGPKDGFLLAFNRFNRVNLTPKGFMDWLRFYGVDGKPSSSFIQAALAPTLRWEVHRRNNLLGKNNQPITDLGLEKQVGNGQGFKNNAVHGMEKDAVFSWIANIFGVSIQVDNALSVFNSSQLIKPMSIVFSNGVGLVKALRYSTDHFRHVGAKVFVKGNNVHFTTKVKGQLKHITQKDSDKTVVQDLHRAYSQCGHKHIEDDPVTSWVKDSMLAFSSKGRLFDQQYQAPGVEGFQELVKEVLSKQGYKGNPLNDRVKKMVDKFKRLNGAQNFINKYGSEAKENVVKKGLNFEKIVSDLSPAIVSVFYPSVLFSLVMVILAFSLRKVANDSNYYRSVRSPS